MEITSSVFKQNGEIPKVYTCDGENYSPPLKISGVPKEAKSLALILEDPDAPMGVFDHWIVWNIPANTQELEEGAVVDREGTNDFGEIGYRGPCPPPGPKHRYFFKMYALDTTIDLEDGSRKDELENAMEGHILAQAELIGTYSR